MNDLDTVSQADLGLLHHALGISDPAYPDRDPYRNHFVAGEGHVDLPGLERLEAKGLMVRTSSPLCRDDHVFSVTPTGRALALRTRPKLPQNKLRYRRYLRLRDAIPDLTFREFVTDPEFASFR